MGDVGRQAGVWGALGLIQMLWVDRLGAHSYLSKSKLPSFSGPVCSSGNWASRSIVQASSED